MKRAIRPTTALGWWTFWLGALSVVWSVLLPSLSELVHAVVGDAAGRGIPTGFASVIIEIVLAVSTLAVGIVALRKGERSWLTLAGFVPAVIVGAFWIFFALGEVLSPH